MGIGQVDRVLGHAERLAENTAHKILRHEAVGAGLGPAVIVTRTRSPASAIARR